MRIGDVIYQTTFKHCQPTIQAGFCAPKGRVAVMLLLGDADKKEPGSFDPAAALHSIGWVEVTELDAALLQVAALREELAKFDQAMRALACNLGTGGYNAEYLTADQLASKVQWGIDNALKVEQHRLAATEQRNAELTNALARAKLWVEDRRRFGDDGTVAEDWLMIMRTLKGHPHPQTEFDKPTESGASE